MKSLILNNNADIIKQSKDLTSALTSACISNNISILKCIYDLLSFLNDVLV